MFCGAIEKKVMWYLIDAEGKVLGRLASRIAGLLRGKDSTTYADNIDPGHGVIVINASKIVLTGNKREEKEYFTHSGFPGKGRKVPFREVEYKSPEKVLKNAVNGMVPKNRLGRKMARRLRVYQGSDHPHAVQKPVVIND